jgi:hypothetical protein
MRPQPDPDISIDTDSAGEERHYYYCCVECLAPAPSLYRRYTTHASVKLTRCQECGLDVDPYVEREAMLIAFDVILHRLAAYRHALFNRDPFAKFCPAASIGRSFKFALGLSILDAYIKFEALRFRLFGHLGEDAAIKDHGGDDDPFMFAHLLACSFLEQIMLLFGTILAAWPLLNRFDVASSSVDSKNHSSNNSVATCIVDLPTRSYIISRLLAAISLPSTFKAVTIFVHIWENSPTTRALGSVFVASMQWMGVHCCMERAMKWIVDAQQSSGEGKGRLESRIALIHVPGYPIIGGFILRSIIPFILGFLLNMPILVRQCSGVHVVAGFGDMQSQDQICFL